LGKIDAAFAALKKSFVLGYDDVNYAVADPDLSFVRQDVRFAAFLNKLTGKM